MEVEELAKKLEEGAAREMKRTISGGNMTKVLKDIISRLELINLNLKRKNIKKQRKHLSDVSLQ